MAAGFISVKRQAVGGVVATLVKWNTTGRSVTHQFSQFALLQSWGRQKEGPWLVIFEMSEEKKSNLSLTEAHAKANSRQLYSSSPSGQSATPSQRSKEGRQLLFTQRYCPGGQPPCGGMVPGTWPGQDSSSDLSAQSISPSHLQLFGMH